MNIWPIHLPFTWEEFWYIVIPCLWLLIIGILWAVHWLAKNYPKEITVARFESKAEAQKFVKQFEAALERDKDKARSHLWKSTL